MKIERRQEITVTFSEYEMGNLVRLLGAMDSRVDSRAGVPEGYSLDLYKELKNSYVPHSDF